MDERFWKLRWRTPKDPDLIGERTFESEAGLILALQTAYRNSATDLVATSPDGRVLTEAVLRRRYPPR
jgi:hypothetical protein